MIGNIPKLARELKLQTQKAPRTSATSRTNTKKSAPRHIAFKLQKITGRENLKRRQRG
jgi:hypothetical protein